MQRDSLSCSSTARVAAAHRLSVRETGQREGAKAGREGGRDGGEKCERKRQREGKREYWRDGARERQTWEEVLVCMCEICEK